MDRNMNSMETQDYIGIVSILFSILPQILPH